MYISVAGNYATGKTTLVSELSEDLDWKALTEVHGSILQRFYDDPHRWALGNQVDYFDLYLRQAIEANASREEGVIQERSLHEAMYVFNKAMEVEGYLAEEEFKVLKRLYDSCRQAVNLNPDLLIYVYCDFDLILERIEKRGREEEQDIDREYLDSLDAMYEDWLNSVDFCQILRLDSGKRDFRKKAVRENIVEEIQDVTGEIP